MVKKTETKAVKKVIATKVIATKVAIEKPVKKEVVIQEKKLTKEAKVVKATKSTKTKASAKETTTKPKVVTPPPSLYQDRPSYGISGKEGALESSEVYDEGDIASALEAGFIAQALERHKEKVAPEWHPDFDGESCLDCGDELPPLRLEMKKIRCVHCQAALEKKNRFYSR